MKLSKIDLHNPEKRIQNRLKAIAEDKWNGETHKINSDNKKAIIRYYEYLVATGKEKVTIDKILAKLHHVAVLIKKDFKKAGKQDITRLMRKLNEMGYSDYTLHDYSVTIKRFWQWLRGIEKKGEYPPEVSWIKTYIAIKPKIEAEDLITPEEQLKLIDAATHPRDKALIATLIDSGLRPSELLNLRIKNVSFDSAGAWLSVLSTKKKEIRQVRVIASAPYLSSWINLHPDKSDPNAPLWIVIGTTKKIAKDIKENKITKKYKHNLHYELTYAALFDLLKRTALKAGIHKKRIFPYLFRHTRLTYFYTHLSQPVAAKQAGHTLTSKMIHVYTHLSNLDVDREMRKLNGLEEPKEESNKLKPIKCLRCGKENGATVKICETCGAYLDLKTALESDAKEKNFTHILKTLAENQTKMAKLLKEISGKKFDIVLPSLEEKTEGY